MTLRNSPFGDMSNAAPVAVTKREVSLLMEKREYFFKFVDTATVAVSDVSPYG